MRKLFLCISALLFAACSGGGGGGGGAVSYKYKVEGVTPFSSDVASPLAAAFTIQWNETSGVISGVYTEGSITRTVTGTSNGGGRTMSMVIDPPESGTARIDLIIATAGDINGPVAATLKAYDINGVQQGFDHIIALTATTTVGGGGGAAITMPTITCNAGVSIFNPSNGNALTLNLVGEGPIFLCIKAGNTFTVPDDPSITDATYTWTQNGSNYRVAELSAAWNSNTTKVMAALCFVNSMDGTLAANISDNGAVGSDTGTFQVHANHMSCP